MQVYLDNSATTRPFPRVVAVMREAMETGWHNPSALYKPAMEAEKRVEAARTDCLKAVNAQGQRMLFTSGGTEADNLAIIGHLRTVKQPGRVLILSVEHPAVLACEDEIRRLGHQVEKIPVTPQGVADLTWLEGALDERVRMICCMQVNNESGAIQPLAEIARLRDARCPAAAIHVDGVQGFLRVPLDFKALRIQSYAFSGHKIHGPKGVGGLIFQRDFRVSPLLFGGGQEDGLRSGTENTPGILGLGEAVRAYPREAPEEMMANKRLLWSLIRQRIPGACLNGPEMEDAACAPHILNVSFPPVRSQTMLFALEGDGIYVSSGSACASRKQKLSSVLMAMGLPAERIDSALRFSLCPGLTEEEMTYTADRLAAHWALLSRFVRR